MEHGLPADLFEYVAPLLIYLDRAHIRYDLTSDLDLALSRGPRASDRTASCWPAPSAGRRAPMGAGCAATCSTAGGSRASAPRACAAA